MDKFQKDYIGLLKSAFDNRIYVLQSDFDWARAVNVSREHNIAPIMFYGALNSGALPDSSHMLELQKMTVKALTVSTRQLYDIEQIESIFKRENIDYMPLKGTILKSLFPKPEMRTMGDADILIKLDQYPAIEKIMADLGFVFQYESDHELVWKKPPLVVELHKSVMTSYNKDFYGYFGDGWQIAKKMSDCSKYEMTDEDFFIYIFVHFTKHYRISGIGIKHLLDLWVYSKARPELDFNYVQGELEKMHLGIFYTNVMKTTRVWFEGEQATDETDLITNVIFNSGQYGTAEMAIVNRALQDGRKSALSAKIAGVFKSLFLPYSEMKKKYKILGKLPILLPVMWMVRCFDIVFFKKDKVKSYKNGMNKINSESIEKNAQALRFVGLDFDNE